MRRLTHFESFSVTALLVSVLFALIIGTLVSKRVEERMLLGAEEVTSGLLSGTLDRAFRGLELGTYPLSAEDSETLKTRLENTYLGPHIVHLKLWSPSGTIIWSDRPELTGSSFPDNDELATALSGRVVSDRLGPDKHEILPGENRTGRLLELYGPVYAGGTGGGDEKPVAVFELYRNLEPLYADLAEIKRKMWTWTFAGFLLLYLALSGIVWRASRKIEKQKEEVSRASFVARASWERAPLGIYVFDEEGSVEFVNPAMLRIAASNSEEFDPLREFELSAENEQALRAKAAGLLGGVPFSLGPLAAGLRRTGGRRFLTFTGHLLREEGRTKGLMFVEDVTCQREAGEALSRAAARWRATFDTIEDALLILDKNLTITAANQAAAVFFSSTTTTLETLSLPIVMRSAGLEDYEPVLEALSSGGYRRTLELYCDSTNRWVAFSADIIKSPEGETGQIICTLRDITEARLLTESLRQARDEWRETFDTINDAITLHDLDFNITNANRAARELGLENPASLLGEKCYRFYHGREKPPEGCISCLTTRTGRTYTLERYEPNLEKYLEIKAFPRFSASGRINGNVHVVRDISERKEAEREQRSLQRQLLQSQKMESVGTLAGNVAHDFNNLLSGIMGYAELTALNLPENHVCRDYVNMIRTAGDKAVALTRQLLAFSRKQEMKMRVLNLNRVIEDFSRLLDRMIGEDVVLDMRLEKRGGDPHILGDESQLGQILLNLAVNARHAMPEGGRLTITTGRKTLREPDMIGQAAELAPGQYIFIEVKDTGTGMEPGILEHIFEPFFTTRKPDTGTGLGLSTVYGIVRQHQGGISVESEPGSGTAFCILLPAVAGSDGSAEVIETPALRGLIGSAGLDKTVLVVDDQEYVRNLLKDILSPLGCKVLLAPTAETALDIVKGRGRPVDLLITDVVMPDINGLELIKKFSTSWPETPVILMSGHSDLHMEARLADGSAPPFLPKPITPSTLFTELRSIWNVGY